MIGSIENLAVAIACFVGGHFVLSSLNLRGFLVGRLGEKGFMAAFGLFAAATFAWVLLAWGAAPWIEIWPYNAWLRLAPMVLMPFSFILVVTGLAAKIVTMSSGEAPAENPGAVSGIYTVTRHPYLWGVVLWGVAHIPVNGDAAGLILFGGMLVLALGGMAHIDHRRRATLGSGWGPIALTTSVIPFRAALEGRCRIDWRGIGWVQPAIGIALYFALIFLHGRIIGVPVVPDFLVNLFD